GTAVTGGARSGPLRIVIAGGGTGGHLIPALALAAALREARPDVEPVLVGAERGVEAQVLPRHPFRYHLVPIEPVYRRAWWRNARAPLAALRAWRAAGWVLDREAPALVIGTGGYAAGPVVWRAQRRGIPTALQEQNALPGLTTRWLARRARQVHLGFPEARARLRVGPRTAVYAFGNPIRPPESGGPGDVAAARAARAALAGALERRLLDAVNVVWGTGPAHAATLERYAVPGRVLVRGFFDPMSIAYRAADVVVARAGAMTVAELCAWGKASILVPLPSAAADHQRRNAQALADAGAALVLAEADLNPFALAAAIMRLVTDPAQRADLAARARARGHPEAARAIVSKILTLVS